MYGFDFDKIVTRILHDKNFFDTYDSKNSVIVFNENTYKKYLTYIVSFANKIDNKVLGVRVCVDENQLEEFRIISDKLIAKKIEQHVCTNDQKLYNEIKRDVDILVRLGHDTSMTQL